MPTPPSDPPNGGSSAEHGAGDLQARITRNLSWNLAYQGYAVVLNFGAMLVLVRVITPAEFGQAATVAGVLHFLNAFNCGSTFAHALQLPGHQEPDWALHWRCGLWIQGGLAAATLALAAAAHWTMTYASLGPLLALAALGELLDVPSRLRAAQLQRRCDFKRLRLINGLANLIGVLCSLTLGLMGHGALGLVLAAHVVVSIPLGADLLLSARWRPGCLASLADWRAYRPALSFGGQQIAAGLLRSTRGFLVSLVLPVTLGFEAVGLLNRAEALFTSTVQRLTNVLAETIYPLLPRLADHPRRFRRLAASFLSITAALTIPGGLFLAIAGPEVSRLLYGIRWIAADPLLAPMALAGGATALGAAAYRTLLARNQLLLALRIDLATAIVGVLPLLAALHGQPLEVYAWAVAGSMASVTLLALVMLARQVPNLALTGRLAPAMLSTAAGSGALYLWSQIVASGWPGALHHVIVQGLLFTLACGLVWWLCFPLALAQLLRDLGLRGRSALRPPI